MKYDVPSVMALGLFHSRARVTDTATLAAEQLQPLLPRATFGLAVPLCDPFAARALAHGAVVDDLKLVEVHAIFIAKLLALALLWRRLGTGGNRRCCRLGVCGNNGDGSAHPAVRCAVVEKRPFGGEGVREGLTYAQKAGFEQDGAVTAGYCVLWVARLVKRPGDTVASLDLEVGLGGVKTPADGVIGGTHDCDQARSHNQALACKHSAM